MTWTALISKFCRISPEHADHIEIVNNNRRNLLDIFIVHYDEFNTEDVWSVEKLWCITISVEMVKIIVTFQFLFAFH